MYNKNSNAQLSDAEMRSSRLFTRCHCDQRCMAGLTVQEGSGRVRHQRLSSPPPTPTPCTKKILTGFLRFARTPLGSSGGGGRTPGLPWPATALIATRHVCPAAAAANAAVYLQCDD